MHKKCKKRKKTKDEGLPYQGLSNTQFYSTVKNNNNDVDCYQFNNISLLKKIMIPLCNYHDFESLPFSNFNK